jgi:hypothetical protein
MSGVPRITQADLDLRRFQVAKYMGKRLTLSVMPLAHIPMSDEPIKAYIEVLSNGVSYTRKPCN